MAGGKRNPDLPLRAASALGMIAVTAAALWLGGMVWVIFVLAIGLGVWFEWRVLVLCFAGPGLGRTVWSAAGAIYCGLAAAVLMVLRDPPQGTLLVSLVLLTVIATDVGAYFTGRAIGGPKIAPAISPSKTWAGLGGGIVLTVASLLGVNAAGGDRVTPFPLSVVVALGVTAAIVAQAGDFFESWMKRRAGVKDSGTLLPGHGGLFDRTDGLMAVLFVLGLLLPFVRIGVRA
jgi:phosphatidate cytidylyltransferase